MQHSDLLDDDVLGTADHAETTALDGTLAALTDQGLVGANGDTELTSLVAKGKDQHDRQEFPDARVLTR